MLTTLRELPRRATHLGLSVARAPLSATEAVLGHRGDPSWPPAIAFDRAGALVKTAVGTMVRDPALVQEGHLEAKKVQQVERAEVLEAAAEARREETIDEVEARRAQAAKRRREATRAKQQRQEAIAEEERTREQEAAARAQDRTEASDQVQEAASQAAERQARRGRKAAIAAEEAALDQERRALAERQDAATLDSEIEAQKIKRATGTT